MTDPDEQMTVSGKSPRCERHLDAMILWDGVLDLMYQIDHGIIPWPPPARECPVCFYLSWKATGGGALLVNPPPR